MPANSHKSSSTPDKIFSGRRGIRILGLRLTSDGTVKGFFGGNAYLAIICLLFICLFLIRAAIGFFPGYRVELSESRQSGVEYVNVIKQEVVGYTALRRKMELAYIAEKRVRFGNDEAVVFLYNRFEAVVDDELEDEVAAFAEMPEGATRDAQAVTLSASVKKHCLNLSPDEITSALSPLGIKSTTPEITQRAIELATEYALNEAEQPASIELIQQKIRDGMGDLTTAFEAMSKAGEPLKNLEGSLAPHAQETIKLLRRQREIPTRIAALREGAAKINDPADRAEKLATAQHLEDGLESHIPIDERAEIFYQSIPIHDQIVQKLILDLDKIRSHLPTESQSAEAQKSITELDKLIPAYGKILNQKKLDLQSWKHDSGLGILSAVKAFFFGTVWQTNSSWENVYGILPLLTGSLLIAGFSLLFAVPVAIGAAIYVNQFSYRREAAFLKPAIEFVQAIPSVVLGLFGVLVLAGLLKDASAHPLLSWIPGFPIQERLNVLLAALLLAFMAAPTIFTLAEDALNNVPKAYSEASLAMGATRLQTAMRIVLPAATSGIIAAILLGFGRVIGETMVVLLVAGNKAAIPDFTQGLAVATQPVHTMTSIIAQECGEVETGSLHYMALFMVGLILFMISLSVNSFCQRVLKGKS